MDEEKKMSEFCISDSAKKEYLISLIGKIYKILHLFEEKESTGFSPDLFIFGQLWEINAANSLFDGRLVPILVKVKGIYDSIETITKKEVKKQVFEMEKIIKSMISTLK